MSSIRGYKTPKEVRVLANTEPIIQRTGDGQYLILDPLLKVPKITITVVGRRKTHTLK